MRRAVVFLLALAACSATPTSKFAFTDITVRLPVDTATFPPRPGVEAMTAYCSACHSTSMILLQPALTTAQWKAEIAKMKQVYKAPVDPAAEPEILAYLEAMSAELGPPAVALTR